MNYISMHQKPEVSIIVPIYNVEKYLEECLESIINQTLKEIEIICIDDCSTDNSLSILKKYQKKSPRIKVIALSQNLKPGNARNKGLNIASAPYIMFVDADDFLEKNALELLYNKMIEQEVDIVISHIINFSEHKQLDPIKENFDSYYNKIKKKEGKYEMKNIIEFRSSTYAKLFKKSIIDKYNIRFPIKLINEDEAFHWTYFSLISNIYFLEQPLYHRRIRDTGIMVQRTINRIGAFDMIKILEITYNNLKQVGTYQKYKEQFFDYFQIHWKQILGRCQNKKQRKNIQLKLKKLENCLFLTPIQRFFSVINTKTHKVIRFLGIKFKIKKF